MSSQNYYSILGVEKTATADDLKKAYRKLAMKYHPDVNKSADAEEKMKDINVAYETLSDPQKRQQYDLTGSTSQYANPQNTYSSQGQFYGDGSMEDLLRAMFEQQRRQQEAYSRQQQRRPQQAPQMSFLTRLLQYFLFFAILNFLLRFLF